MAPGFASPLPPSTAKIPMVSEEHNSALAGVLSTHKLAAAAGTGACCSSSLPCPRLVWPHGEAAPHTSPAFTDPSPPYSSSHQLVLPIWAQERGPEGHPSLAFQAQRCSGQHLRFPPLHFEWVFMYVAQSPPDPSQENSFLPKRLFPCQSSSFWEQKSAMLLHTAAQGPWQGRLG